MLGTYVLSAGYYDAYYSKAMKVRTLIKKDFDEAFKKVDVIIGPTSPTTAFKLGEHANNPLAMYLEDVYTVNVNLAGIPSLALPCGKDKNGLPIGMQIIGPQFSEDILYRTGNAYEKVSRGEI
jgi:aspartyl-tRNA(Asn)/glutamyl-tRNA(Gln) amidotransferase subunit A